MIRTVARSIVTLVAGAAIAVSGAGVASAAAAAPAEVTAPASAAQTLTLTPVAIPGFEWVSGNPQWAQPSFDRLGRSVFQIDDSGNFVMHQPDGYPALVGTVAADGTFQAAASSTAGANGSVTVEALGQLVVSDGALFMQLTYVSGATTAAVVNGTAFGDSRVKAYHATIQLSVS